jgi:hypothetical protein
MSEELFNSLLEMGLKFLHIQVTNFVLSSAWLSKSKKIKKQAWIEYKLGDDQFELNLMTAPQLATDVIFGADFLNDFDVVLDFSNCSFVTRHEDVVRKHRFSYGVEICSQQTVLRREIKYCENVIRRLYLLNNKAI